MTSGYFWQLYANKFENLIEMENSKKNATY